MKLLQLQYFQQACLHGSISLAAEALHVSQPSVSVAIRELEEEFGLSLLNRRRGLFSLTREGQQFFEQVNSLLTHAERFSSTMHTLSRQEIQLGVPPMIGSLLLPRLYAALRETSQPFHIQMCEGGREELVSKLGSYQLDMAFLPHEDVPPDEAQERYLSIPVMQLETVCCTSLREPLGALASMDVLQLCGVPLVLFGSGFFQTRSVLERFSSCQLTPNILLQTDQLSTIHRMIADDLAVGFLFRQLADTLPGIRSVPLRPAMPVSVSLFWKRDLPMTPGKRRFLEFVRTLRLNEAQAARI